MQITQRTVSMTLPDADSVQVANDPLVHPSLLESPWHGDASRSYPERITLRDGREVLVRPITPAARPLIEAAMKKLSPETSRRRFFTVRYELSETELDRLTNLDGSRQFALGAVSVGPDGQEIGVGVARWVRADEDPASADFALLVVDGWQHLGLGSMLLARLATIAAEHGITRFTGSVLADNSPMFALIERYAPLAVRTRGRDFDTVEFLVAPGTARFAA